MHIEHLEQHMRLMAHALPQTLKLRPVEIILQDRLVLWMRALVNNDSSPLPRRQSADVRQALFCHDDVQIMLRLIDMRTHGHDTAHARRIRLARARARRVHDAVLGGAEEVGAATEAVQHAATHDAGAVGVGIDVDFDGRVHADDAEAADDFGRVGDLLRAEEELGVVVFPAVVEALEAFGREADRGRGCEVKMVTVEEVEKGVLEDFRPDLEVAEVGVAVLWECGHQARELQGLDATADDLRKVRQ